MDSFEAARKVIERLQRSGYEAYLAGGCVRDRLLGRTPKDHDVATAAPPKRVIALFRRTRRVGAQFGVILVHLDGVDVEVATFRTDGDYRDGRRPESVTFTSAREDAQRRDFTINGMFYDPLADRLVDYVGGQRDLAARIVRCIGDPARRFAEDHLRLLRAVRFAARLDFAIDEKTFTAMRETAPRIADISPERVLLELEAILTHPQRRRGWQLITETGLEKHLIHGHPWSPAQARRAERILGELPERTTCATALAAGLECFATGLARSACRTLRCSNEATQTVGFLLESIPRLLSEGDIELADLKTLRASGRFEALKALVRAVAAVDGKNPATLDAVLERAERIAPEDVAPPPLLTGDDLLAMAIPPGPSYRRVLDRVYRAQLNEEIQSKSAAIALAREALDRA